MAPLQYDGLITIATGSSRRSASWKTKELLWFVDKLGRVTRTQAEYFRMPKEERDNAKDVGGFVGGTLKGGRRKIDAVQQRRLITLDMDSITAGEDPWPTVELIRCSTALTAIRRRRRVCAWCCRCQGQRNTRRSPAELPAI